MAVLQCGCTFFAADGGGPLTRDGLPECGGIRCTNPPDQRALEHLGNQFALCGETVALSADSIDEPEPWLQNVCTPYDVPFVQDDGLVFARISRPWQRLLPGRRHTDWLIYADPLRSEDIPGEPRRFYGAQDEIGGGFVIGDLLYVSSASHGYDAGTGEWVGGQQSTAALAMVGYTRIRKVRPVAEDGGKGLQTLLDPATDLADAKFDLRDGTAILCGLIGWGRVNHKRYIQIAWIPIPVGRAD
jgi:hypothetical protein